MPNSVKPTAPKSARRKLRSPPTLGLISSGSGTHYSAPFPSTWRSLPPVLPLWVPQSSCFLQLGSAPLPRSQFFRPLGQLESSVAYLLSTCRPSHV